MSPGAVDPLTGLMNWRALVFVTRGDPLSVNHLVADGAAGLMLVGGAIAVGLMTVKGWWRPLWRDWLTSLDHKRIGVMYVALALVMMARAIAEAVVMRTQQAAAVGSPGFLDAHHFGELFSTHGTIMIFFVAMPFLTGLMNFVMPLQIGARDVSFPLLNAISLALTAAGAALVMVSLVYGGFSTGGWTGYPPFTGIRYSPGPGVDTWIWSVSLSSIGSTLTGLNFAVTLYKNRAPGMTFFRMPLFSWVTLCVSILMIFAMAPLTVATVMLALDRYADFHFFTVDAGGNMMNYANLFWLFGHPEVYILILPAFGVWSEVISTFSAKQLYGYHSLVAATMVISVLSFTVWLHHFFTMGQSANVNAIFGIATMLIGIPTGVKIYDWLLTMVRGRIRLTVPMLFAIVFMITFLIGGLTGVILANPTIDFVFHNSLFLVAHFHNMLIPGFLFAMIAAVQFWFPKVFGFRLDERLGRISFWLWAVGFYLAFMPLYVLGLMGAMRRTMEWQRPEYLPWLAIALVGALCLLAAFLTFAAQIAVSVRRRDALAVPGGDPWDGLSLEWSLPAPVPEYNFAVLPRVGARDPFMAMKREGRAYLRPEAYEDIRLPKNSPAAPIILAATFLTGFALTWHIWWLAIAGLVTCWIPITLRSFREDHERVIPASEVRRQHEAWLDRVAALPAIRREDETGPRNRGRASSQFAGGQP